MVSGVIKVINKIISAICKALHNEFGYEVYKERIEQGLKEPCFFVQSVSPSNVPTIIGRRRRECQYSIVFFPESGKPYEAINAAIERLYDALEIITVDDVKIRGKDIATAVTDDVLTFLITYDFFMVSLHEDDNMDGYEIEQRGE